MGAAEKAECLLGNSGSANGFKGAVDYAEFSYKEVSEPAISYSGREEADDTDPVSGRIKGDVNADKAFNVADLVMLQGYILGKNGLTDSRAGDLAEDGEIDVFDMVEMRRLILIDGSVR